MSPMPLDRFSKVLGDTMRMGEPGPCVEFPSMRERQWHTIRADAYEALREMGTAGITYCTECGKAIYVPSYGDAGIPIRGLRRYVQDMPIQAETLQPNYVRSQCGHAQEAPTAQEIDGCDEIIVRRCEYCDVPLWWNVDQWRTFT